MPPTTPRGASTARQALVPNSHRYPLAANTVTDDDVRAAISVLRSGNHTMGKQVRDFELAFAEYVGSDFAVMVNSGSSANLLMLEALLRPAYGRGYLRPGDEVLVPALSWPTTVWPIVQLGLIPVFVDVDIRTLAIDLDSARSAMSERTRGMFVIHVLGQPAPMTEYVDFRREHGMALIEDACESLGARSAGKHVGTHGLMGSFSCYFSHHITTIEGGMVVTSDAGIYKDLRSMRSHGWSRDRSDVGDWESANPNIDPRFLFVTTGFNIRPTEVQAAIGVGNLRRFPRMLDERIELARRAANWTKELAPWLRLIGEESLHEPDAGGHSWMMLPFLLARDAPAPKQTVVSVFESLGVETRPIIAGNLVRHPATQRVPHRAAESLEVADQVLDRGFMIGCNPGASSTQLSALREALEAVAAL